MPSNDDFIAQMHEWMDTHQPPVNLVDGYHMMGRYLAEHGVTTQEQNDEAISLLERFLTPANGNASPEETAAEWRELEAEARAFLAQIIPPQEPSP